MSTSFLYHSSSIQGVKYKATSYDGSKMIFDVEPKRQLFVCPQCKSDDVIKNGGQKRLIRNLKMGRKTTMIRIFQPRLRCKSCGTSRMME
jgi:transposase